MYPPQDPYSSSQDPYSSQNPYASPPQGAAPYASQNPYASPGAQPYPQQGSYAPPSYAPQGPYASPPQAAYPPQYPYMAPSINMIAGNPRAKRAMIQGFISLAFSLLTLFTLVGYAGLITGTLAIVYGFMGMNAASKLPNKAGRGQALTGVVLGFIAWGIVILSFIIRSAHGTSG